MRDDLLKRAITRSVLEQAQGFLPLSESDCRERKKALDQPSATTLCVGHERTSAGVVLGVL
jgi:hypothetical protein